jgi:thioredoxin 1
MSWAGYLVIAFVALALAYMLWSGLSMRTVRGQSVEALFPALPGLAERQGRAVIYCYSEHCGPCRKMAPDIDRLATDHPNLFKLDVTRHHREARALGIRATPTTLLVENGTVLKALLGAGAVAPVEVFLSQG